MDQQNSTNPSNIIKWMMQTDQVSDQDLIDVVVDAFSAELVQFVALGLVLIGQPVDEPQIHNIVTKSLAEMVLHRRQYWGETAVQSRLFMFLLKQFPTPESSKKQPDDPQLRNLADLFQANQMGGLALLLRARFGCSLADLSQILGVDMETATSLLVTSYLDLAGLPADIGKEIMIPVLTELIDPESGPASLGESEEEKAAAARLIAVVDQMIAAGLTNCGLPLDDRTYSKIKQATAFLGASDQKRKRLTWLLRLVAQVGVILLIFAWFFRPGSPLTTQPTMTPWPTATTFIPPSPTVVPENLLLFDYRILPADTLESIAEKAGQSIEMIMKLNQPGALEPLIPGQTLKIPVVIALPESQQVRTVMLQPLTAQSSGLAIIERMKNSDLYWNTVWATTQQIYYGPPGYAGMPVQSTWTQIWLRQPGVLLKAVISSQDTGLVRLILWSGGRVYSRYRNHGQPIDMSVTWLEGEQKLSRQFIDADEDWPPDKIKVLGKDIVAGRSAVIIELQPPQENIALARIWVDAVTGLVLRRQDIAGVVIRDIAVTQVVYDAEMPEKIFVKGMTTLDWFAVDESITTLQESASYPPSLDWEEKAAARQHGVCGTNSRSVDYSKEPVTLIWPIPGRLPTCGRTSEEGETLLEIYAGRTFLGNLSLETNPSVDLAFQSCSRSPDGRYLALLTINSRFSSGTSSLYWIDLALPSGANLAATSPTLIGPVRFAANSQHMAYIIIQNGQPGVAIFDINTGENKFFPSGINTLIKYFNWSKDGEAIGLILNKLTSPYIPEQVYAGTEYILRVIDASTGGELYSSPIQWADWEAGVIPKSLPVEEWEYFSPEAFEAGCQTP